MRHLLLIGMLAMWGSNAAMAGAHLKGVPVIDTAFSGSWYDPSHDGEGLLVEILPDDRALSYWFTYDTEGNQLWIMAVGTVAGNEIRFENALAPRGARFGEGFDSADVELQDWGSYTVTFDGCDSGQLHYDGIFGEGTQDLVRLTAIAGTRCGEAAKALNNSVSAAWFDPQRVGEGFLIEVLSETRALVYWFTYDLEGGPMWVIGDGAIDRNRVLVESAITTRGGRFGPDFDPNEVERIPFGPMAFSFNASGSLGTMAFVGPDESFGLGEMRLVRLTQLDDVVIGFDGPSFAVTGTLAPAPNLVIDSDVNNPELPFASNDTADTAQTLPNPLKVAGYASEQPGGLPGSRFATDIDTLDVYRAELAGGQSLFLDVADHLPADRAANDLDLLLFSVDDVETPVAASQSIDAREQLTVPASGEYFIVVNAFAGRSNYLLSSGQDGAGMAAKMGVTLPFRDFEAIVRLDDGGKSTWTAGLMPKGLYLKGGQPDREMLLELGAAKSDRALTAVEKTFAKAGFGLGSRAAWETIIGIKATAGDPAVRYAEPNYVYRTQIEPNDEFYSLQWHYPLVRLPQAWDIETGSPDVVVAVIDTGVAAHPDNMGNVDYSIGFDFVSSRLQSLDFDGIDEDADDPGDRSNADGSGSYHGTHVAGTVGGDGNNGLGLTGIAWDVTIMPVRALGRGGSGSGFDIVQAFRWSAGLDNDSGMLPARPADIVNMSLGGPGSSRAMADAVIEAREAGVIVVAAAGNSNIDSPFFPAAYEGVVSVAATTITDEKALYSNFGPTIDIAAPGGNVQADVDGDGFGDGVLSLLFDDSVSPRQPNFVFYNGTSMASPHVAGIAALMKTVHPDMTPEAFDQAIASGQITVDLADDGAAVRDDLFGFGRIDALDAVTWARDAAGGAESPPILAPSVMSLRFDALTESREITVSNAGDGELEVADVISDQPWLTAEPVSVDENGLGTYAVNADRTDLPDGLYQGSLTFVSSAGEAVIAVSLEVGETEVAGAFGTVYMLLLDPLTGGVLEQTTVEGADPTVRFEAVLPGEYLLVGGTDLDNDGEVCDAGELCGGVPDADSPETFEVDDDDVDVGGIPVAAGLGLGSPSEESKRGFRRTAGSD